MHKETLIKEVLKRDFDDLYATHTVMLIYNYLEKMGIEKAEELIEFIDNLYVDKFKVDREEAILLKNILYYEIDVYRLGSDFGDSHSYIDFIPKGGKVRNLFTHNVDIKYARINDFKNLKELTINSGESTQDYSYLDLPDLKVLEIEDLAIQDMDKLKVITTFKNLRDFRLTNGYIEELKYLNNLKKLEKLTLHGNYNESWRKRFPSSPENPGLTSVSSIENLVNLKELTIKMHKIKNFDGLKKLVNLERLTISYTPLDHVPEFIRDLKNLRYLDISHNHITELPEWIKPKFNQSFLDSQGKERVFKYHGYD
jgi:hypothetical protein